MNSNIFTEDMSLPNNQDWDFFQQTSADDYLKKLQKTLESENRFFIDKRFSYTINIQHLLRLVKLLNPRHIHRNVRL